MITTWFRGLAGADRMLLGLGLVWTAACVGPGHVWFMHLLHPVVLAISAVWGLIVGHRVIHAGLAGRALTRLSRPATLQGIAVRVLAIPQGGAFALGGIRPQIYIAQESLDRLDQDELSAVLLHEDYHRRTMAPLRAAAIESLLAMCGWIPFVGAAMRRRLADLEIRADRWALARGVQPRAIASAILKEDPGPAAAPGAGFAGQSAVRVRWLTGGGGSGGLSRSTLAWEVAPLVFAILPLMACVSAMSLA